MSTGRPILLYPSFNTLLQQLFNQSRPMVYGLHCVIIVSFEEEHQAETLFSRDIFVINQLILPYFSSFYSNY
ncbi:Uncharacterized protein HZ326_27841 [Fusarium oxysporum f. sp. albedinis]|nr:Uncharacterized protein HZ326_27841 [Fusarium oxysporum f. sp. albedinis]